MKDKIEEVLNTEVRPFLMSHGGNVELVEITEDNVVRVRLQGGCSGCPGSKATLKNIVESALKEKLPEIKEVEAVE
jgi:Fe-S cluster biogenesis protein NfuA